MTQSLESVAVTVGSYTFDFFFRPNSIGDKGVIGQIFTQNDYDITIFPLYKRFRRYINRIIDDGRQPLIIDAGANIGASSLYFNALYPESKIIAVEPDIGNCDIFRVNCGRIDNITLVEGGIASNDGLMALEDPGLSDWGFRLVDPKDKNDKCVRVYSISNLLAERSHEYCVPIIVKIDIEGGESELFRECTTWLRNIPLLIIELHDWMLPGVASSRNFLRSISSLNFDFLYRGENVFCFNNELLMSNNLDDTAEDLLTSIASRDAQIHELQQDVLTLRADLNAIHCSRSWRIVNVARRLRTFLHKQ